MTDQIKTNDDTNWRARLAGKVIVATTDNKGPDYGFYRIRRGSEWQTIAYGYDGGELVCVLNGSYIDETPALNFWIEASKNPISQELYSAVRKALREGTPPPWPDVNQVVEATRSNLAPDDNSFEGLRDAVDSLMREANQWKEKGPKNEDDVNQIATVGQRLSKLSTRGDKARKEEKAPLLAQTAEVEKKWQDFVVRLAANMAFDLKQLCEGFLRDRQRERDRQAAALREEAERIARQAALAEAQAREALEKAHQLGDNSKDMAEAKRKQDEADQQARAAAEVAQKARIVEAQRNVIKTPDGSLHLRAAPPQVTIIDRAEVLKYFADSEAITATLQTLAERATRAGVNVPGVKVIREQVVR